MRSESKRACRGAAAGSLISLAALAGLAGPGCAPKQVIRATPDPVESRGELESTVISASPAADAAALAAANEELTQADWEVLESIGPKTIWEKLGQKSRANIVKPEGEAADADDAQTPEARASVPPIDESTLPLQITELPDNKIRMIWRLRAYGGAQIKSSRDNATSRRNVAVSNGDLGPIVQAVQAVVGNTGSIVPLPSENTLVITCPADYRTSLVDLLAKLDVLPPQVEITAKIFEVSQDFDFQYGANLIANRIASDGAQSAISTFNAKRFTEAMRTNTTAQGSVVRLMQVFQSAGLSVDLTFQILAEEGLINVVSSPRMTVTLGQTGYMLAGQELPIQSAKIVNGVLQSDTQYKPVGVQLYVTPQTIADNRVKLHAISIVSSVSGFSPLPSMTGDEMRMFMNPIIDSREAETAVTVNAGDTLVISGLKMVRTISRENKVPGLGDIPVMGALFKNHRSQQQMTDLYFFLTPNLLPS